MDPRFYQKIKIFEIQNFNKIPSFTISFFFSVFDIFFSILPVEGFQKNCKIFVLFYCIDPRFYQKNMQNYGFF